MADDSLDLEPLLSSLEDGAKISVVAELIMFCPGSHIGRMIHTKQIFRTDASIDPNTAKFSILLGTKRLIGSNFWIQTDVDSRILRHPTLAVDHLRKLVETCAGLGIVGKGFHTCGIETVCYNEVNPAFCEWNRKRNQAPTVEGDLTQDTTTGKIFDVVGTPHILSAGISCQPFSYLGDKRENKDRRSTSLTGTLRMAYINQSAMVVLECTPAANDSKWVQDILQEFCATAGYKLQQRILHLDSMWPAVRNRWWAVLAHPAFEIAQIPEMPVLRFKPSIMHLISTMLHPSEHVMKQIALDSFELERFSNQKGGIGKYVLNAYRPLPTATHSWGSQMTACQCGCRTGGFKQSRLDDKGLHAVLIPIGDFTKQGDNVYYGMRHILPQEVCMLNGMCPSNFIPNQDSNIRLELAGVGQMASPLQSCWVMGNILFDLQKQGLIHDVPAPRHIISKLCQELIRERNLFWASQKRNKYLEIFELELSSIDHPVVFPTQEDHSNDDEHFTQTLKEICPTIEATLAMLGSDDSAETAKKKGKGGIIPVKHSLTHPPMKHPFVTHDMPQGQTDRHHNQNAEPEIVFPTNGGIPGFETGTKKRHHPEQPEQRQEHRPENARDSAKKIKIDGTIEFSSQLIEKIDAKLEQPIPKIEKTEESKQEPDKTCQHTPNGSSATCKVLTALPLEKLTEVKCGCHHTVGQFALAEAHLMDVPAPLQTTDLVGNHIPISSQIQDEQIIMLNPSLEDYQKCPRQTTASHSPNLAHLTRFDAVWHQKGWVAWDEMEYYLATIKEDSKINTCKPVDFTNQKHIDDIQQTFVQALDNPENKTQKIFTAGWFQQHWFPIEAIVQEEGWSITIPSEIQFMVQDKITPAFRGEKVLFHGCSVPSKFGADCGFRSIAWILNQQSQQQTSLPMTAQEAIRWRLLFAESLTNGEKGNIKFGDTKLGGMNETQVKNELIQLVESHGVNPNRSQECTSHLIRVLGVPAVQSVLASGNPWKDLKTRATSQSPPIQIVLTSELQQAIVARTKAGLSFGSRKNKQKGHQPKSPFVLKHPESKCHHPSSNNRMANCLAKLA